MSETGVMLGITYTNTETATMLARAAIALVLSVGVLLVTLTQLVCGGRSNPRTESRIAPDRSRKWREEWFAVLITNLPLSLCFGFTLATGAGTVGMLAGIVVVWLIGYLVVAHLREVRAPLMLGGTVVAVLQVLPVAHICAGMLALIAVTGRADGEVASAGDGFVVMVLTAALLAVVALVIGFVLRAVRPFEGQSARNQY